MTSANLYPVKTVRGSYIKIITKAFYLFFALSWTVQLPAQCCVGQKVVIRFTQAWVWEYTDKSGVTADMVVYFEPQKNYWLFTAEAYGTSGEMINWVLGRPDGSFIFNFTDETGNSKLDTLKLEIDREPFLPVNFKPTGRTALFGDTALGFPVFKGSEYAVSFQKTADQYVTMLTTVRINFLPVYYFNRLNSDAKLPVSFYYLLPENTLILSDRLKASSAPFFRFKYISHTVYEL